jgi:transposase
MSRSALAAERWREIVKEQTCSKQTVAEYCRQRGIAASSLFAWKRRLKRAAGGVAPAMAASTFVEAKVKSDDRVGDEPGGEGFPSESCIEIRCVGERRIMVRKGFDPEALKQVVAVLETLA